MMLRRNEPRHLRVARQMGFIHYRFREFQMPKFAAIVRAVVPGVRSWWRDRFPKTSRATASLDAVLLRDGDSLLASVRDGKVIAFTHDISLSHAEFVRRDLGELPDGAWVGTIRKVGRTIVAVNSRTFFGNQLPAPQVVIDAIRSSFA